MKSKLHFDYASVKHTDVEITVVTSQFCCHDRFQVAPREFLVVLVSFRQR
jgi:hypothetical protein